MQSPTGWQRITRNDEPRKSMPHLLLVGCGFVGEATADLFHAAGWQVTAWTASLESAGRLAAVKPYHVAPQDITDAVSLAKARDGLPAVDALVDCVSSGKGGAEAYRRIYLDGARRLLEAFQPKRFLFTGSTSVYAQLDGSWVDEASPAEPDRETGRILRETEDLIAAHGGVTARLAGLYGPGRSVLLRKFLTDEALIEGDGKRWMNFCHRDDAAAALFALATAAELTPGVYNVSDDTPLTQVDCYRALAEFAGKPLPPFGPVDLGRKRGWTSKRVSNARLKSAVAWKPLFPSFTGWAAKEIAREDPNLDFQ